MPSFGKRMDVPGGCRSGRRERVALVGSAATSIGPKSVIVEDVCSTGAKLHGKDLPQSGEDLVVNVGAIELRGAVAWSKGERRGFSFDTHLTEEEVRVVKAEGLLGRVMGIAIV